MSHPFTFLPRAVSFEPVYLVRFKLEKLIQLRLRALIEAHNQVFPAPKNERVHRRGSAPSSFRFVGHTTKKRSELELQTKVLLTECGWSQRLGDRELR